ncbi:MAG: SWIM zinc finger family protein, partial [Chitinophagales bacterium]
YKYGGSTSVASSASAVGMSFAPDTHRDPTFFVGELSKNIAFREAISVLHHVVVSDLRFKPKDKSDYKAWAAEQEKIWLAEHLAKTPDLTNKIKEMQRELGELRSTKSKVMKPYWDARSKFFRFLLKRDYDAWFVLDPVITVHPDQLFFECFSQDESTYGKLSCSYNVFKNIDSFECGTTNIDYSSDLYNEFQKIREYKSTNFTIDPSGFEVQTTNEDSYKEVKIDLPDTWVRGFLQVSSAMTLDAATVELHPMDVWNMCFMLRRNKANSSPRSMKYVLKPGKPVEIIFEPWNYKVVCSRSIYKGNTEKEVRVWGRRRLLILERLIPIAKKFTVHLLGSGLPSFYIADLGDMDFTLGLSGWTSNDWSRAGNFDLMAPRANVDSLTKKLVFDSLKETWQESASELAKRTGLTTDTVTGALSAYTQAGRVIYDLTNQVYRVRELSQDPLPMSALRFANEREAKANQLVDSGNIGALQSHVVQDKGLKIVGSIKDKRKTYTAEMVIDRDERMVQAKCDCNFYQQNKLFKGPCEHILATRIAHRKHKGK